MKHKLHYYLSLSQAELMAKGAVPKLARRLASIGRDHGESEGELKSHRSVITAARKLIRRAKVSNIAAVLELGFCGSSRRVDLVLLGKNKYSNQSTIILLEIKNFDNTISIPDSEEDRKAFMIYTDTYGSIEHPSLKAKDYLKLLYSAVPELLDEDKYKVLSFGHAPRYRWEMNPVLFNALYAPALESNHCFDRETEKHLVDIIRRELSGGHGEEVLHELLMLSKYDEGVTARRVPTLGGI